MLLPIRQGETGVQGINAVLQNLLNPYEHSRPQLERGGRILRVGDRVMQNRNDYQRDIFNGDVGFVVAVGDGGLTVHYPPLQRKQGETAGPGVSRTLHFAVISSGCIPRSACKALDWQVTDCRC